MAEIEPRLLELAEVAKAAQLPQDEALNGPSVPVSIYHQIENPLHFKNAVAVLRQPDRPLSERVFDSMAVLVTSIIAERNILDELQEMLMNNRDAVAEAEGAVAEHILPEDTLLAPNISGFRKTAEDLEFIFGLNARGLELLPEVLPPEVVVSATEVVMPELPAPEPKPEPEESEDPVITAERRRLLRNFVFRGGGFFLGGKKLRLSNQARIKELERLREHLNTVWIGDNLAVSKEELDAIAEANGNTGVSTGRAPSPADMSALNRGVFAHPRYQETPMHVEFMHDPKNSRMIYYRLREGVPTVKVHRRPAEDDLVGEKNNGVEDGNWVQPEHRPLISPQSRAVFS